MRAIETAGASSTSRRSQARVVQVPNPLPGELARSRPTVNYRLDYPIYPRCISACLYFLTNEVKARKAHVWPAGGGH